MKNLIFYISIVVLLFSCGNNKEEEKTTKTDSSASCSKPSEISNPNGMSEMSLIMEEWYSELKKVNEELKQGRKAETVRGFDFEKVKTAKTSKQDVHGDVFNGFVDAFAVNYNSIQSAATVEEQIKQFNLTITACVNCHEQHCHGPLVRINKLRIKN